VTLDESLEEGDEVLGVEGFEVVIDRALHQTLGMVTIDYCPENGVVVKSSGSSGPACQQKAPA